MTRGQRRSVRALIGAAALGAADLVGALKGDGPFTVFAQTDEDFAAQAQNVPLEHGASPEEICKAVDFILDAGAMTVGELVQVSALFTGLAFPMRVLGFFLESAPPSYVAKGRLAAAMKDERPREADHAATGASVVRLPERPAALEIRGLGIAHRTEHGDRVEVLRDVDLTVADGEVVALVGSTGSGKSSVVAAIAGLVEHEGEVSYGGVPVEQLDPVRRADAIRIGLQEPFLFAASVADNVTLDRVDVSDDEIAQALATAHAADFVAELEHGTDTVVGARGLTLSGGQRQRVALARTLAGAPRVVVLDDATSAIDPVIERRILDGLRAGDAPPSAPGDRERARAHQGRPLRLAAPSRRAGITETSARSGSGSPREASSSPAPSSSRPCPTGGRCTPTS